MEVVALLDADPELGADLEPEDLRRARERLRVQVVEVRRGDSPSGLVEADRRGHLGLLVLGGMLLRDSAIGATAGSELLCRGDLLRPFEDDGEEAPVPFHISLTALEDSSLALLDRRFAYAASPWPEITAQLMGRATRRSRWLAVRLAINAVPRVDTRLLLTFWHLADRLGHVTKEGVVIDVRLTHRALGRLVGAQRPSVTTALTQLANRGSLLRRADGTWVLHGDPPEELARIDPRFRAPRLAAAS
jgi:CRP-like cAMP-binding protein